MNPNDFDSISDWWKAWIQEMQKKSEHPLMDMNFTPETIANIKKIYEDAHSDVGNSAEPGIIKTQEPANSISLADAKNVVKTWKIRRRNGCLMSEMTGGYSDIYNKLKPLFDHIEQKDENTFRVW